MKILFGIMCMCALLCLVTGCESDGSSAPARDFGDNNQDVIVALGDSITAGGYPNSLSAITGKRVIDAGVGGESTSGGASRVRVLLARHKPGYLLILLGSNDAINSRSSNQAIGNLRYIIQVAKDNKTVPIIATLPPMYDSHVYFNGAAKVISAGIRGLASEQGISMADLQSDFGGNRSLIGADGLHPTAEGANVIARSFANQL